MRPSAGRRLPGRTDRWAVLVLVLLPLALFVLPALAGYPAIGGDNAIQNFPLRVFTGQLIQQGHLPLWNPYIWSGSPLLGGLNAGSFYPLTFVFAALPPVAAWVVNLLAVYWAAGLGLYALGRQLRLRPLPCLLAALTYGFGGAMAGQLVHLPIVQGMGWMPLLVLAQLRLSWAVLGTGPVGAPAGKAGRSPWPWVVLLAAMVGLVALTGEPRSMVEAEVVGVVVTAWLVLRPYGAPAVAPARRLGFLGLSALAAVWGAALSAAQLLPGWSFINASQRANESYAYFGTGSLRPAWTTLMLVPDLFGGDGLFGQPTYFNRYNLPEVTGYIGLLPLVAALALATRSLGRRRDPRSSDWGLWLLLAGLGVLMAWGSFTPLGHLLVHIPLFGKTRLQSRNIGIADLALAMLLAFWADRVLGQRARAPAAAGAAGPPAGEAPSEAPFGGWRRWVAAVPALATGVLCLVALAAPVALEEAFGADPVGAALGGRLAPWFAAQLVVSLAVLGLLFGWRRLGPIGRRRGLTGLVLADLFLFVLSTSTGLTPGHTTLEPTTARAAAVFGHDGRFAVYDTTALNIEDLSAVGQPDLNVLTKLPSVQGYGSILSDTYGSATGTHGLDALDPCALARGVFTPLRLATLLALPAFLAPGLVDGQAPPAPPACPGAPPAGTAGHRTFYLGRSVQLSGASLVRIGHPGTRQDLLALRVGVLGSTGRTTWPAESVDRTAAGWSVRFDVPERAAGLVVTGPASQVSATSVVDGTAGGRWALDGVLQQALGQPGWRYTGNRTSYGRFVRTAVRPPVWVAGSPAGAGARQLRATEWGSAVDRVTAPAAVTVVRSQAYMPGWHVRAVPAGDGPARELPVVRVGLVQGVRVPAGRWTLTFLYRPPGLTAGLVASAAALIAFLAAAVVALVRHRRRPGRGPATPPRTAAPPTTPRPDRSGRPAAGGPRVQR
ncbi:MAG TPA: hypothetical protein VHW47_10180 [Acidimicrobiales bacterium]|nr:hypothetical protein [Acidimicrobiales bacterium]